MLVLVLLAKRELRRVEITERRGSARAPNDLAGAAGWNLFDACVFCIGGRVYKTGGNRFGVNF